MIRRCDKPLCNNKTPKSLGPPSVLICSSPAKPLCPPAVCSPPRLRGVPKGGWTTPLVPEGKTRPDSLFSAAAIASFARKSGAPRHTCRCRACGASSRAEGAGNRQPYSPAPNPTSGHRGRVRGQVPGSHGGHTMTVQHFQLLGQLPPSPAGRQGGPQLFPAEGWGAARLPGLRRGRAGGPALPWGTQGGRAACWRESARRRSPLPPGTPPPRFPGSQPRSPPRESSPEPLSAARRSAARPGIVCPAPGGRSGAPPGSTCRLPAPLPPARTYHTEP